MMTEPSSTAVHGLNQQAGELSFEIDHPFGSQRVRYWGDMPESREPPLEPALAAALLPAMKAGGSLSLPSAPSPQLRRSLPDIQAVLASLAEASPIVHDRLQLIDVTAPEQAGSTNGRLAREPRGVGAFFSGGVDSWSTVLSNPEVTDLIYVHGFDVPVEQTDASHIIEKHLSEAAGSLGKNLRVIRTNLRAFLDPIVSWEIVYGAALASVAHLFASDCRRVLIAASATYGELVNRGSHPLHDHLWSTEGCRIELDGAHRTRAAKTEQVASSQEALDVLRVCWREVGSYNCGRCEKCIRTMVALDIVGALSRCTTFPSELDLKAVATVQIDDPEMIHAWRENLGLAQKHEASTALIDAIHACLHANERTTRDDLSRANKSAESLERELLALHHSRSWRLTAPLRKAAGAARRLTRS